MFITMVLRKKRKGVNSVGQKGTRAPHTKREFAVWAKQQDINITSIESSGGTSLSAVRASV